MVVGDLKNSIDSLWMRFHTGGVSNPMEVIKQITYLLFIKRLDDLEIAKEKRANITGKAVVDPIFAEGEQELRWSKFKNLEAGAMFDLVRDKVFRFMKNIGNSDSAFAEYMRNAYLAIPNAVVLEQVVTMIDAIPMDDMDTKGDVYEYMLSKLSTSGDNGQFRTPRHITKLMARLMKPTPDDVVCDPACGTAGFLVAVSEYLREHYEKAFFDKQFVEFYKNEMFHGCEFDETMISISAMNLMLHGIENPDLYDKNSLEEDYTVADRFSLILANPPFKGSLESSTVAKSLSNTVKTKKTELLFLALMLRTMKIGGRCAVIVPDGVLFGSDKAAVGIRQQIIDKQKLDAVISMPSGVFRPYAGVSTAILIFTKTESGGTDQVWFYDMKADGFTLNDTRTPTPDNDDTEDIIARWEKRENETTRTRLDQSFFVPVDEIRSNNYDLSINKYKETVYEQKHYDAPAVILERLDNLDLEILNTRKELEEMLMKGGADE